MGAGFLDRGPSGSRGSAIVPCDGMPQIRQVAVEIADRPRYDEETRGFCLDVYEYTSIWISVERAKYSAKGAGYTKYGVLPSGPNGISNMGKARPKPSFSLMCAAFTP